MELMLMVPRLGTQILPIYLGGGPGAVLTSM